MTDFYDGPTREQAEAAHANLAAQLIVAWDAARHLADDHEARPMRDLLETAPADAAWALGVLLGHAIEYGADRALDEALESLRLDVEAVAS